MYISNIKQHLVTSKNKIMGTVKKAETPKTAEQPKLLQIEVEHNAAVKTFMQTITDDETGVVVKNLYYLRIVRGNVTVQINVGEKTYTQVKTLTEAPEIKEEKPA